MRARMQMIAPSSHRAIAPSGECIPEAKRLRASVSPSRSVAEGAPSSAAPGTDSCGTAADAREAWAFGAGVIMDAGSGCTGLAPASLESESMELVNAQQIIPEAGRRRAGYASDGMRKEWQQWQDDAILEAVGRLGPKWRAISALFPDRSDDAVRNRWTRLQMRGSAPSSAADTDSAKEPPKRAPQEARHSWTAEEDAVIRAGVEQVRSHSTQAAAPPHSE